VVHAAAVYSYDPRQTRAIGETNLRAAELVLGHAVRRGLDPVIHVSSIVSLFPGSGGPLTRRSEPGAGVDPYSVSKAASERLARTLQAGGAPVVSVLPGGVIGPDDPYLGETNRGIVDAVAGRSPLLPRGASIAFVDARDLAEVIARALEPGRGPRRYLVAPHYHGFADLIALARRLTGRRLPIVLIPDGFALVGARLADLVQRVVPFDLPLHAATLREVLAFAPVDDSDTWSELGIVPRPLEETFADTVRWAARAGHLAPRHLGRLQGAVPPILGA
jgi:dihydroflavonol-4-reductase